MNTPADQARQVFLPQAVEGDYVAPAHVDQYFSEEPNLIAAFDFDYDTITEFQIKQRWACLLATPPVLFASSLCCYPCFLNQQVHWDARSQHVCLTVDGIRYVKERRKSFCGFRCNDKGKESKTVPYDKITDCDVQEPAGNACCCCIPNVLSQVHIDTASSGQPKEGGGVKHELELTGLVNPMAFKHSVWGMKRRIAPPGASVPMSMPPAQAEMTQTLLTEIRDELRTLNEHMKRSQK